MDAIQVTSRQNLLADIFPSGNPGATPESQDVGRAIEVVPSVYIGIRPGTALSREPTLFRSVKRPGV